MEDTIPALKNAIVPEMERKRLTSRKRRRAVDVVAERVRNAIVRIAVADRAAPRGYGRSQWSERKEVRLTGARCQEDRKSVV